MIDDLTEVSNRRHLEAEIETRLNEIARHGLPFGLIFMDIDRFRDFNGSHGHDAGDALLRLLARALSSSVRAYDLIGRWSGEEFVSVVRHVDRDNLTHIAERYRKLLANSFVQQGERRLGVTVSIGATIAKPGDTVESLIRRAGGLMAISQGQGGNRVTVEE